MTAVGGAPGRAAGAADASGEVPTFTPLSFRSGVLEGGMGVRFPAGLKTLGAVGLRKGACFGMPLSGAAERTAPVGGRLGRGCPAQQDSGEWLVPCHFHAVPQEAEAAPPAPWTGARPRAPPAPREPVRCSAGMTPIPTDWLGL